MVMQCGDQGRLLMHKVKAVLYAGTAHEEVIYDKKRNYYFITSMVLTRTSWVKSVKVVSACVE